MRRDCVSEPSLCSGEGRVCVQVGRLSLGEREREGKGRFRRVLWILGWAPSPYSSPLARGGRRNSYRKSMPA